MRERWVQTELRFLRGYAVVMSLVAAVFLVAAVRADTTTASFDTITVHRINVTDADGKTRLALFGKQWEPPSFWEEKPTPVEVGHRLPG